MTQRASVATCRPCMLTRALAVALAACLSAAPIMADGDSEAAQLAALLRQLQVLEQLVATSSQSASSEHTRYHFDYVRLKDDLARVRTGIEDYLSPERAQPRDPNVLVGDYRREDRKP